LPARRADGAPEVPSALRRERLALAAALAIGDLAGTFPLAQVMAELSAFADRALDGAIADAIRRRVPDAEPAGFAGIALGKHGAGELNYSSDIDPLLLYAPDRLPRRERDEPAEAAQRYARTIVETLAQQTGEGYVFRVDLRLRPAAEVSPLALSFNAALSHYESSALAWERAAFIRARAASGDLSAGGEFLAAIRPFVWRRNLDFTAIEEISRLTARIRQAYRGPREPGPGFDIKRGRGGIREVEFFAQTHQLIYGGRLPALRQRGTRAALDALAAEGIIAADDARCSARPTTACARSSTGCRWSTTGRPIRCRPTPPRSTSVARLDGLADGAALIAELRALCGEVAARYDRLLGDGERRRPAAAIRSGRARALRRARAHGARRSAACAGSRRAPRSMRCCLTCSRRSSCAPEPDHALAAGKRCFAAAERGQPVPLVRAAARPARAGAARADSRRSGWPMSSPGGPNCSTG
jgi:glutamate-ammonia-ligase adenylyltransferase